MVLTADDTPVIDGTGSESGRQTLVEMIERAAHLLPSQGPITVFVHHNTLHAFERLSFEQGVAAGGRLYRCHAYLPEEQYRKLLSHGRIRVVDLEAVLLEDLGDEAELFVALFGTRYALRLAMLHDPLVGAVCNPRCHRLRLLRAGPAGRRRRP